MRCVAPRFLRECSCVPHAVYLLDHDDRALGKTVARRASLPICFVALGPLPVHFFCGELDSGSAEHTAYVAPLAARDSLVACAAHAATYSGTPCAFAASDP